jgi:hypothetical protein
LDLLPQETEEMIGITSGSGVVGRKNLLAFLDMHRSNPQQLNLVLVREAARAAAAQLAALAPARPVVVTVGWELAEVYGFGASKYRERDWEAGVKTSWLCQAAARHLYLSQLVGEHIDPESARPHTAHALWQLVGIIWMTQHQPDFVDQEITQ